MQLRTYGHPAAVYRPIEPFRRSPFDEHFRLPPMLEQNICPERLRRHSDYVLRILRPRVAVMQQEKALKLIKFKDVRRGVPSFLRKDNTDT